MYFYFLFFFPEKKCTKKSFLSVQSNIQTMEAEHFQRDMEAIKTLKYCTSFVWYITKLASAVRLNKEGVYGRRHMQYSILAYCITTGSIGI